jgi:hypothetical protein
VNVVQLLSDFLLAEDVEVIRAGKPEGRRSGVFHETRAASGKALPRHPLLENLHDYRNTSIVRFADKQVDMLRHDHVTNHLEFIFLPDFFKDIQEQVAARRGAKERLPPVATTGDVVEVATSVPAAQSFGHGKEFYTSFEREGWKFVNPPFAAAISRVCRTDMWAAKDGAPTFCVRDECEG